MEREKLSQLAIQAGMKEGTSSFGHDWFATNATIEAFARLIEQETLERAIKRIDEKVEPGKFNWYKAGLYDSIVAIRNLKDNHDKE